MQMLPKRTWENGKMTKDLVLGLVKDQMGSNMKGSGSIIENMVTVSLLTEAKLKKENTRTMF